MKRYFYIVLLTSLIISCSEESSKEQNMLSEALSKLLVDKKITLDKLTDVTSEFASLMKNNPNEASNLAFYWDSLSKLDEFPENLLPHGVLEKNSLKDFTSQKIDLYASQIEENLSKKDIEDEQLKLSKSFVEKQNKEIKNWTGEIIYIDLYKQKELDIALSIITKQDVARKEVGENIYKCKYTIEVSQESSTKRGTKGISRSGELYEKIKQLKEGDLVKFSANIINVTDNTPKTGIFLGTHFEIELTDISKK